MEAKHTQQGDRHEVVITCTSNEILATCRMLRIGGATPTSKVLRHEGARYDHAAYEEARDQVLLTWRMLLQNINRAMAEEQLREENPA